jgi:hypothetical protein
MHSLLNVVKNYEETIPCVADYEPVIMLSQIFHVPELAIVATLSYIKNNPRVTSLCGIGALANRPTTAFVTSALEWQPGQEVPFSVVLTSYPD